MPVIVEMDVRIAKIGSQVIDYPVHVRVGLREYLISVADFERVQGFLNDRRPIFTHPRTVSSPYILSGFAYCSKCGSAMIGTAAKSGKYLYYECDARFKKGKDSCVGLRVRKDMVEKFALEKIREDILTKENLTKLVSLVNDELLNTYSHREKQLDDTEKNLAQIFFG